MRIKGNDRVHIFGRTGQGKSRLAEWIFTQMQSPTKIILNSKPDKDLLIKYPEWSATWPKEKNTGVVHIARFVPKETQLTGWDDVLSKWQRGNTVFYFDELPNHADAHRWPDHLQKIFQTGRNFGVGAICCSQRPVSVPNFTISEADHVFVFFTQLKSDREKLEGATGVNWDFLRDLPPYHCGYYSREIGRAVVMKPVNI